MGALKGSIDFFLNHGQFFFQCEPPLGGEIFKQN